MEFEELLRKRFSCRSYGGQAVLERDVMRILEAARSAPSAGNLQAYRIVVVRERSVRERLAAAALGQRFIAQAPVVLVFLADPERSAQRYGRRGWSLYCVQDATIACSYAQLAVVDLGLAGVWVGAFDDDEVLVSLGLSAPLRPVALLPIGHPAEKSGVQSRRPLSELISFI